MTPQLLIASAELLGMDVPATFRRALGHGVGFRSLDEEARFEALLNDATAAKPSRWRNQDRRGGRNGFVGRAAPPQRGGSQRSDGGDAERADEREENVAAIPSSRLPRTMEEARFARRAAP